MEMLWVLGDSFLLLSWDQGRAMLKQARRVPMVCGLGCTSQSRTDRELGEREGGLPGVGSCDQPWVGRGVSSHRRGEDGSPHTAL